MSQPSSFGAASWTFPTVDLGLKSKTLRTEMGDGMRWRCPNQHRRRCRRRDDAVGVFTGALVADVLLPERTPEAPLTAHVQHV